MSLKYRIRFAILSRFPHARKDAERGPDPRLTRFAASGTHPGPISFDRSPTELYSLPLEDQSGVALCRSRGPL
jgi:hypothetical protein